MTARDREWAELASRFRLLQQTKGSEVDEIGSLMSAITEGIVAVNRKFEVLFYNSVFALLFGKKGFQGREITLSEIFDLPEIHETLLRVMNSGETTSVTTSLTVYQETAVRDFSISIAPLRRRGGAEITGAVALFHDITEIKRAERIRIEFVENVSHELRTPLTSIKGYAETLWEDLRLGDLTEASRHLEIIVRNTDRLMSLVDDLLEISSLESGADISKSSVRTKEVTERVLEQLATKRKNYEQKIRVHYGSDDVLAEPRRVEQVLSNLVDNALKYTPKDRTIDIFWERTATGDVQLRVVDDGPGIPPEHLPRLFERFYRIDKARSRERGGTGLGLSIVKHIMHRHGGSVEARSELNRGSEFICRFPGV